MSESYLKESILDSILDQLGVVDDAFINSVMTGINSTFTILYQLGVGPTEPFRITSRENMWDEFITRADIELVKTYVYLKTRQFFDPPTVATLYEAIDKQIKELEWRLLIACDGESGGNTDGE